MDTDPGITLDSGALCSIERTLEIVGEKWSLLILRTAMVDQTTRFRDFQLRLGIAPNILTQRLARLVATGVLTKRTYREEGTRTRDSYHLTPAGQTLKLVLASLQQWGDDHVPPECGATLERRTVEDDMPIRVGFLDPAGRPRDLDDVQFVPTPSYPGLASSPDAQH